MTADLILYNGRFSTLDRNNPSPEAAAVADGRFLSVGRARGM
jgi:predicted amidohydrolase YtcJ